MASFLRQVGGREIHRNPLPRQRQSDGGQRGAHALPAFAHGLVGQTYKVELSAARIRNVDLDVHFARFDTLEGYSVDMGDGHEGDRTNPAAAPLISIPMLLPLLDSMKANLTWEWGKGYTALC